MRGIAAILVLELHVFYYFSLTDSSLPVFDHVYLAVDCFYVISGFVIAHSFDPKLATGMSFPRFAWLRILRLYPMIVIGVLLGSVTLVALWRMQPGISPFAILQAIVSGLLLIPTTALAQFKPWVFPANSPHWSLSFEMVACLTYALSFRFLKGRVLIIVTLLAAVALATVSRLGSGLDIGYRVSDYALAFGRVFYPFFIGVMIRRSPFFAAKSSNWGYLAIPILLVVLINPIPASWQYDAIVDIFALPLLVFLVASSKRSPLDSCAAVAGEISYPLYAIHFPLVVAFSNASKIWHFTPLSNLVLAVATSVVAIALAYALNHYVDVPARRYFGRLADDWLRLTRTPKLLPGE